MSQNIHTTKCYCTFILLIYEIALYSFYRCHCRFAVVETGFGLWFPVLRCRVERCGNERVGSKKAAIFGSVGGDLSRDEITWHPPSMSLLGLCCGAAGHLGWSDWCRWRYSLTGIVHTVVGTFSRATADVRWNACTDFTPLDTVSGLVATSETSEWVSRV